MPIAAIIALVASLAPEAIKLINNLMPLFEGKSTVEQAALLEEMKSSLSPMVLKP